MSESAPPDDEQDETESSVRVVKDVTMDGGEVNFGDANGEVTGDVRR